MDAHAEMEALAEPYIRGELDEAVDAEIMAHAEQCEGCLRLLQAAEARIRAPERFWRSPRFHRAVKIYVAAAVAVGLVCLGNVFKYAGLSTAVEAQEPVKGRAARQAPEALPEDPDFMQSYAFSSRGGADLEPNKKLLDMEEGGARYANVFGGRMSRSMRGGTPSTGKVFVPDADPWVDDRKIVRNARMQIEVDAFDKAQDAAVEIATAEKGFLAGVETQKLPNGKTSGTLTVRIPADRFDAALPRFRALGVVRNQSIHTQDVTKSYVDLQARRATKEALIERLKKVLADGQGKVTELMEVELQMSSAVEALEKIKGEIQYYDNVVGLSTLVLAIQEKDLAQPFEYVESLRANLGLGVRDVEAVYAKVQAALGQGQLVESTLTRADGGTARGVVRAHVEAEKFPALRDELRSFGPVTRDTVDRRRAAQGGEAASGPAPVKRERAFVEVFVEPASPQVTRWTRLEIEAGDVDGRYQEARKAFEETGAKLTDGTLEAGAERSSGTLKAEVDADKAPALVARLSSLGKTRSSSTRQGLPAAGSAWERTEVTLSLATPPVLIPAEHGLARAVRDTFTGSVAGLLWSVERLFVGLFLVLPWAALALLGWLTWRRLRRRKEAAVQAAS